jgi:hypothetical protein
VDTITNDSPLAFHFEDIGSLFVFAMFAGVIGTAGLKYVIELN